MAKLRLATGGGRISRADKIARAPVDFRRAAPNHDSPSLVRYSSTRGDTCRRRFLSCCRQSCERQAGGSGETDPRFDRGTAFDSSDTIAAHLRPKPADIDKRARQSCYIAWPAALGQHRSIRHTASISVFLDTAQHQRTSAIIRQDDFFPSGGAVARHREDARI